MISAIVISVIMMFAVTSIGDFVSTHTFEILTLAFLIIVGTSLISENVDFHIPKGHIYFTRAFSLIVEIIVSRLGNRKRQLSSKQHFHTNSLNADSYRIVQFL